MSRRKPGRLRIKLAAILRAALPDIDVWPEDLREASGWYRTSNSIQNDAYRWEAFTRLRALPNVDVVFGSFSTMTDCVCWGISVGRDGPVGSALLDIVVESNKPAPASAATKKGGR